MADPRTQHVPVMPREVLHWLDAQPGQVLVDGTLGGGGHTRLLAEAVGGRESFSCGVCVSPQDQAAVRHEKDSRPRSEGRVIALDRDPEALARAEVSLAGLPVTLVESNFCDLPEVLRQLKIDAVDGVLLDLGLSSDQLADAARGFSFSSEGPLDLRFNPHEGEPAARLVNRLSEHHLADLIFHYGEERYSRRIAAAIIEERRTRPIETAAHLAQIVRRAVSGSPRSRGERIDSATRTFQALRIAVNDELRWLEIALRRIPECLRSGGCFVVISFHSLEDRRVKEAFRGDERLEALTRRPIQASEEEVEHNSRARSAKLRAARRLAGV